MFTRIMSVSLKLGQNLKLCEFRSLSSSQKMTTIPEKALARGTECPPPTKDFLRIYSMRFCPFAQRTRMVLVHKNIPHETVNVNLRRKPIWLWERNPLGLVPVLELNGEIIYESTVCDDYLDEVYPVNRLNPTDPYARAQHRMLMECFGKIIGMFYQSMRKMEVEKKDRMLSQLDRLLLHFEDKLPGDFFGGAKPCMVDLHIWPWVERFPVIEKLLGCSLLPLDRFPKLNSWRKNMFATEPVKATMFDAAMHEKFILSLMNRHPDYDIGLEQSKL